jgi:hypothetical protein
MGIRSTFIKVIEWIGHGQPINTILGWIGFPSLGLGALGWAVTFFGSAAEGWSVTGVWLASLAAGLMCAATYAAIAITLVHRKAVARAPAAAVPISVNRTTFSREALTVSDLIQNSDQPLISGMTFERCLIRGPAYLKFQAFNVVEFCSVPGEPRRSFQTLPKGAPISGTILLSRSIFKFCQFENVAFVGTEADIKQMMGGFHQMATKEWKKQNC